MATHGSGDDLGRFGELAYRLFDRLPMWAGLAIPFGVFIATLETAEALLGAWRSSLPWLRPALVYDVFAFGLVPLIAFTFAFLVSELAFITYISKGGRWKLLHLQKSLRDIRSLPPRDFERLVGAAYEQMGYRVDYAVEGQDGGFDLLMRRGSEKALVQCKNWYRGWTGVSEVRELYGVATSEGAAKSIFVTSGVFTEEAIAFAKRKPLELLDGEDLLTLIDSIHGSSVSRPTGARSVSSIPILDVNSEKRCPICGAPTIRKTAHRGEHAGTPFWSCSRFPDCAGIAPG